MHFLTTLATAARKRALYLRTKSELKALPVDVAHDLGIDRTQAGKVAHRAVYGY